MATALDLLMSTNEDVNLLSEESDICTIDAKTRAIFVPSTIIVGGVQSDKNAERIKFSCPKIVGDNLDLSKFSVRINFENVSSVDFNVSIKDQYICDDVAVDGENVTFSWLIGRNAARYMGTVRFIVCAVKTDSDSNISVEWNTAIAEVPVLEGIEIGQPQIGQEEKDVINQLLELTKSTSAEAVQNVNSAKEQAIKDIQSVSQPDTTLTVEGGLAEAKATGEAIGSLKEDLSDISDAMTLITSDNLFDESKQTTGYQYYKDGTIHENSIMAISDFIEVDNSRELFFGKRNLDNSVDHTYVANVIEFGEKKTYIKGTSDVTNIILDKNTKLIRFSRNLNSQPHGIILSYDDYAKKFVPYERHYVCVDKKTTRYNAKYYGVLTTNSSTDNFNALMSLMEYVSNLGGGVIYIPAGTYNLSNANNKRFSFNNITVIGDGYSTRLVRWGIYPIINICGTSKNSGGKHCNNITFRDISFVSSQAYKNAMKAIMIFECVSYLRIDSCDFNGNGSHIEMREVYDSKIISTDFTNSGRKYKESDVNDALFDVNHVVYNDLQNTAPTLIFASNGAETYNPDIENTNQVLFWGCRIESFTDGAIGVVGTGTNMLRFTDCKFESILSTTPFVMVCSTFVASAFENCVFYRPTILFGRNDRMVVDTVPIFFLNSGMDISRNKITGNLSLYYNDEDFVQMKVPLVVCGKKTQNNIIELFFKPTNNNGIKYLKDGVNVVSEESGNNIINII